MVSGGKTNEWQSPVPVAWEFAGQEYKGLIGNGYSLGYAGLDDGSSGGIAGDGIGDSGLPVATDGEGDAYPLVAPLEDYSARLWWVNPSGLAAVWLGPLTSEPYLLPAGKSLVFAEAGVSTEAFLRGPGDEDSGTSFTYSLRFYSVLPQPGKSYLV